MAAVMITYDLHAPGRDYKDLHEAIQGLGTWWHYLESTWIVVTPLTPSTVWDRIAATCDKNDSVLVIDVSRRSRAGWLPEKSWEWLNQYL